MLVGYTRVSTEDQHMDPQYDALARAGCGRIFTARLFYRYHRLSPYQLLWVVTDSSM